MKKVLSALVAMVLALTIVPPASATSAVTGMKKITVATVSAATARTPKVFDLGKGKVLVSWVEESGNESIFLKTKVVSATNKLSSVVTVNTQPAFSSMSLDSMPQISMNSKGKLFAAWIQRTTVGDVVTDQVYGRTSTNGSTWSKAFKVSTPVVADQAFCEDSFSDGCAVSAIQISIDSTGRTGVLVRTAVEEGIFDYKVAVTSNTSKWPALKLLGTVVNPRESEIVGLATGFAVSWMDYVGGESCATKVAYFDGKSSKWGSTLTAQTIQKNTVVFSNWVQRDSKTLTLVMGSQLEEGGITVRNFSLVKKTWAGAAKLVAASEPSVVFQKISAGVKGKSLAIGYTTYNQQSGVTQARMLVQKTTTGTFSKKTLENGVDQIDPVITSFNKSGTAFFIYNQLGKPSRLTMFKSSAKPMDLPGRSAIAYNEAASISTSDVLSTVSIAYDNDKSYVTLVKGKLR